MDYLIELGFFTYLKKIFGGDDYELYKDVLPSTNDEKQKDLTTKFLD